MSVTHSAVHNFMFCRTTRASVQATQDGDKHWCADITEGGQGA